MLNECKICPRCHCSSAYVVSVYNSTSQPTFMKKFVCRNCGYEFDEPIFKDREKQKEKQSMRVYYNGFAGDLMKIERVKVMNGYDYVLVIYDSENKVTYSFTGVNLNDVRFLNMSVSFNG